MEQVPLPVEALGVGRQVDLAVQLPGRGGRGLGVGRAQTTTALVWPSTPAFTSVAPSRSPTTVARTVAVTGGATASHRKARMSSTATATVPGHQLAGRVGEDLDDPGHGHEREQRR